MKRTRLSPRVARWLGVGLGVLAFGTNADFMSNLNESSSFEEPQDVVVSLKVNPLTHPEEACLAVTLARALGMQGLNNVSLFPTLDGVALGDRRIVGKRRIKCDTPFPEPQPVSLKDNLERFLQDNDANMVICPLCWAERYGDAEPDYGYLPGEGDPAVMMLLLNAEKVIDIN
jgi:hypothetical protein